jgi:hypothetical protein
LRFLEGGPNIPDKLLHERDAGRVVFLCGAGVSMPHLPSFHSLTEYVIERLKPSPESPAVKALASWNGVEGEPPYNSGTSFDQIFNFLQMEFGRDKINALVAERLSATELTSESHDHHGIVAKISTDTDGKAQIVTTNFDLLFEQVVPNPKRHTPPSFPDLKNGMSLGGITYLHGRLEVSEEETHDYILSSSDFGRAYLVQGWATSFVRQLLDHYTVVLLGYQAEDPPIKYLLQGLRSGQEHVRDRLYAFDKGSPEDVKSKWADRGVTAIPYDGEPDHSNLWDTLRQWAKRADNPLQWRQSILDLAQMGPQHCKPHERGMVMHLINSTTGAKVFADAKPVIPVEWLCVFDKFIRFGRAASRTFGGEEKFDPQLVYGLDSDPQRPEPQTFGSRLPDCEDPINWRPGDESLDYRERFAGSSSSIFSARLKHLARWAASQTHEPTLAWWVARQHRLHPALIDNLVRQVDSSKRLNRDARATWRILLDALTAPSIDPHNLDWFRLRDIVKQDGWSRPTIRLFESIMKPVYEISPPLGVDGASPPQGKWSEVPLRTVFSVDVHFPTTHNEEIDCPDHILPSLFSSFERNLMLGSQLLADIESTGLLLESLYPENETDDDSYISNQGAYLKAFVAFLHRMVELAPSDVRAHVRLWPANDSYFFDKLRLYVWNIEGLFTVDEVVSSLQKLPGEQLWNSQNRRELLFLLRDRWNEMSAGQHHTVCKKLLDERSDLKPIEGYDSEQHHRQRVARAQKWLKLKACQIPPEIEEDYNKLKSSIENWSDDWAISAASSNEMRFGTVEVNSDPSILSKAPIAEIVDLALNHSGRSNFGDFVENEPFIGLAKTSPHRALAALQSKAESGEYPSVFWQQLYTNWPEDAPSNQTRRFYLCMRNLPNEILVELRGSLGDWFKNRFPQLVSEDMDFGFSIFDALLAKLLAEGATATQSAIGDQRRAGVIIYKSRKTINYARNSLVGNVLEGLFRVLESSNLSKNEGIPPELSERMVTLLGAPGEGADHAVSVLCERLPTLIRLDPEWSRRIVTPLLSLDVDTAEAAWSGLLSQPWQYVRNCFSEIKPDFVELPDYLEEWSWDQDDRGTFHNLLVFAAVDPSVEEGLSFDHARDVLRKVPQSGREKVIQVLGRIGSANRDGWSQFVIPFVREAWPQELSYQNEGTTKAWLALLDDTDTSFPEVFSTVKEFLRHVYSMNLSLFRFHHTTGDQEPLTVKFPDDALEMVHRIVPKSATHISFDLSQMLTLLEDVKPEIVSDQRFYRLRELEHRM